MSFADLNASFGDLRDGLRAQVGNSAISELLIRPPASEADEASFLRLTAWSYAMLFEAGRISIPFLLELNYPGATATIAQQHKQTRTDVQSLRTWLFHNLTFDENHGLNVRRIVSAWFVDTCEATSPTSKAHWRTCFRRLCIDVHALVRHCSVALSAVATSPEDRDIVFDDLRRRLARDWEPYQFDIIVQDSAARLGEKINAKAFRDRRLADWRRYISALPEDADLEQQMERLIDGEVVDHFRSVLPVRTQDIMDVLGLDPGPEVGRAIELARRIFELGVRDRDQLLSRVQDEFVQLDTNK